jgi:hypothetical protein
LSGGIGLSGEAKLIEERLIYIDGGGLFGLFVDYLMGIFHLVDEDANTQADGKEGAEQQKIVGDLFPREKKQESGDHQKFDAHGRITYGYTLRHKDSILNIGISRLILNPLQAIELEKTLRSQTDGTSDPQGHRLF